MPPHDFASPVLPHNLRKKSGDKGATVHGAGPALGQRATRALLMTSVNLETEYRSTRAALVSAGINVTDSIDALYRDWLRWRERSKVRTDVDRIATANADQWWARHLAQFRSLIDPQHVAARSERARKDLHAERMKPRPGKTGRPPLVLVTRE